MRSCFAQKDRMIVYRLDLMEASGACTVSACAWTLFIPFASQDFESWVHLGTTWDLLCQDHS